MENLTDNHPTKKYVYLPCPPEKGNWNAVRIIRKKTSDLLPHEIAFVEKTKNLHPDVELHLLFLRDAIKELFAKNNSENAMHSPTDLPKPTELTGGKVNYYLVKVDYPQRKEQPPYQAECEDLIEALDLKPDEANIFKEIWRSANARKANGKPGHSAKYGAEKIFHYAGRILARFNR